ncbi:hypothetical protein OF83DRAFT_873181 [Amylostereum chailletii]|nr:hypothetical protein OF83DRAFT_873181 [Amylostereum chailletii]
MQYFRGTYDGAGARSHCNQYRHSILPTPNPPDSPRSHPTRLKCCCTSFATHTVCPWFQRSSGGGHEGSPALGSRYRALSLDGSPTTSEAGPSMPADPNSKSIRRNSPGTSRQPQATTMQFSVPRPNRGLFVDIAREGRRACCVRRGYGPVGLDKGGRFRRIFVSQTPKIRWRAPLALQWRAAILLNLYSPTFSTQRRHGPTSINALASFST